ncbi:hypothetical protein ABPG72_021745 [Tetrahymena utriculariae]
MLNELSQKKKNFIKKNLKSKTDLSHSPQTAVKTAEKKTNNLAACCGITKKLKIYSTEAVQAYKRRLQSVNLQKQQNKNGEREKKTKRIHAAARCSQCQMHQHDSDRPKKNAFAQNFNFFSLLHKIKQNLSMTTNIIIIRKQYYKYNKLTYYQHQIKIIRHTRGRQGVTSERKYGVQKFTTTHKPKQLTEHFSNEVSKAKQGWTELQIGGLTRSDPQAKTWWDNMAFVCRQWLVKSALYPSLDEAFRSVERG